MKRLDVVKLLIFLNPKVDTPMLAAAAAAL